jgi:hypothetical protein
MEEVAKYFDGDEADVVELTIAQKEKNEMEDGEAPEQTVHI